MENIINRFSPLTKVVENYGITKQTFYNWHREGKITLKKMGGRTFVNLEEFFANMQNVEREGLAKDIALEIENHGN